MVICTASWQATTSGSWTIVTASTTTVDSTTQITAVAPKSSFLNAQEPYKVKVISFEELTIDLCKKFKAGTIIRGLRAISDFDYEFQMTGMNARLNSKMKDLTKGTKSDTNIQHKLNEIFILFKTT